MTYQYILGGILASLPVAYYVFVILKTRRDKASLNKRQEEHDVRSANMGSPVEEDRSSDVIIVGAGVAGAALAYSLGKDGRRVHVIERDLREPKRIVGELLQPGGYLKLLELGLEECVNGIDAQRIHGTVIYKDGANVKLPYPLEKFQSDVSGRAFHNGRFIQKMREKCASLPNVKLEQGTVTSLLKVKGIVKGVRYKTQNGQEMIVDASLTVVCDGIFSNLRKVLCKPKIFETCHCVGWIVENCQVQQHPNHGYVILADPAPILYYPISSTESRCFVVMPSTKLPAISNGEFAHYLRTVVAPQVPPELYSIFTSNIDKRSLRTMPNCRMSASPSFVPGALLFGDALSIRNPHTAGGMTVALNDVVVLRNLLRHCHNLNDASALCKHIQSFYSLRKPMAITIDTLSAMIDEVFCSPPTLAMKEIRQISFDFLNIRFASMSTAEAAAALLSGLKPSLLSMALLIFCSAMYGTIRILLKFPRPSCLWHGARIFWALARLIVATVWTKGIRNSPETTS